MIKIRSFNDNSFLWESLSFSFPWFIILYGLKEINFIAVLLSYPCCTIWYYRQGRIGLLLHFLTRHNSVPTINEEIKTLHLQLWASTKQNAGQQWSLFFFFLMQIHGMIGQWCNIDIQRIGLSNMGIRISIYIYMYIYIYIYNFVFHLNKQWTLPLSPLKINIYWEWKGNEGSINITIRMKFTC